MRPAMMSRLPPFSCAAFVGRRTGSLGSSATRPRTTMGASGSFSMPTFVPAASRTLFVSQAASFASIEASESDEATVEATSFGWNCGPMSWTRR
jgi:hypothetical protein